MGDPGEFCTMLTPRPSAVRHADLIDRMAGGNIDAVQAAFDRFVDALGSFASMAGTSFPGDGQSSTSARGEIEEDQLLSEQAYERLESLIVSGHYCPGVILSAAPISSELGIGRTPVREALQHLADNGLVSIIPRRGIVVCDFEQCDLEQLCEARLPLEILLARLAARRMTPEHRASLGRLMHALSTAASSSDHVAILELDRRIKRTLVQAADNVHLGDALGPMHSIARALYFRGKTTVETDVAESYRELLDAVISGDEERAAGNAVCYVAETTRVMRDARARSRQVDDAQPFPSRIVAAP